MNAEYINWFRFVVIQSISHISNHFYLKFRYFSIIFRLLIRRCMNGKMNLVDINHEQCD